MHDPETFIQAVKSGDQASVESMLDRNPSLAEVEADGVPALMLAAYYGHPHIAGIIGARKGRLTLFEGATVGDAEHLVSLLSEDASGVNEYSADGFTALGFACYFGHLDAAEALLRHGADASLASKNPLGVMPLHSALSGNHREIVELLVEHGAPINGASAEGWTPLHYAAHNGDAEMAEYLVQHGAKPCAGPEGKTPADMAREACAEDLARRLDSLA
jgi:uncharacterized protein